MARWRSKGPIARSEARLAGCRAELVGASVRKLASPQCQNADAAVSEYIRGAIRKKSGARVFSTG